MYVHTQVYLVRIGKYIGLLSLKQILLYAFVKGTT